MTFPPLLKFVPTMNMTQGHIVEILTLELDPVSHFKQLMKIINRFIFPPQHHREDPYRGCLSSGRATNSSWHINVHHV